MRRIATELSIAAVAAAMMAALVLVAGSAIGSAAWEVVVSYTVRPPLCTTSYCEPAEIVPTTAVQFEPAVQATAATPDED